LVIRIIVVSELPYNTILKQGISIVVMNYQKYALILYILINKESELI